MPPFVLVHPTTFVDIHTCCASVEQLSCLSSVDFGIFPLNVRVVFLAEIPEMSVMSGVRRSESSPEQLDCPIVKLVHIISTMYTYFTDFCPCVFSDTFLLHLKLLLI